MVTAWPRRRRMRRSRRATAPARPSPEPGVTTMQTERRSSAGAGGSIAVDGAGRGATCIVCGVVGGSIGGREDGHPPREEEAGDRDRRGGRDRDQHPADAAVREG